MVKDTLDLSPITVAGIGRYSPGLLIGRAARIYFSRIRRRRLWIQPSFAQSYERRISRNLPASDGVVFSMKLPWKDARVEEESNRGKRTVGESRAYSGGKARGKKLRIFLADQHAAAVTAYIISSGDASRLGWEDPPTRERKEGKRRKNERENYLAGKNNRVSPVFHVLAPFARDNTHNGKMTKRVRNERCANYVHTKN